jgi:hypothetical protein
MTIAIIAALTVLVLLATPRIFERLHFAGDEPEVSSPHATEAAREPAESIASGSLPD